MILESKLNKMMTRWSYNITMVLLVLDYSINFLSRF